MTDAMYGYLALNQLMLGKKVKELPSSLVDYLKREKLIDDYAKAASIKPVKLTGLEKLFVNLMRASDYAFNIPDGSNAPLLLSDVAKIVRENSYESDSCVHWAAYLISAVEGSLTGEDYIADGVLHLTPKTKKQNIDLMACMQRAFSMFCYGAVQSTTRQREALNKLLSLVIIDGDTPIRTVDIQNTLRALVASQLSPQDVGSYVLTISDLVPLFKRLQALVYWASSARTAVNVVVPRGKSQHTVVLAVLDTEDFLNTVSTNSRAFVNASARGKRLVFQDKEKIDIQSEVENAG